MTNMYMYINKANHCVCLFKSTFIIMLNSFASCGFIKTIKSLILTKNFSKIEILHKNHFLILVD